MLGVHTQKFFTGRVCGQKSLETTGLSYLVTSILACVFLLGSLSCFPFLLENLCILI